MPRMPPYHALERKGAMDHLFPFLGTSPVATSRKTIAHRRTIGKVVLITLEQNYTRVDWNYYFFRGGQRQEEGKCWGGAYNISAKYSFVPRLLLTAVTREALLACPVTAASDCFLQRITTRSLLASNRVYRQGVTLRKLSLVQIIWPSGVFPSAFHLSTT